MKLLVYKIGIVVLLAFIALALGHVVKNTQQQPSSTTKPLPVTLGIIETGKASVPFSENKNASVSVSYPLLSDPFLSALFKKQAFDRVEAFESESLSSRYDDNRNEYTLETVYTREESALYTTYVFSTYIYTGGAHGNQFRSTTTFDKAGTLVTLDTLFTDVPTALKAISEYAKAQRAETEFNTDMWLSGLDPSVDIYNRYIVRDDSLEFLFDPYEIAPYSSGLQKIIVPKSVYQDYLR